MSDILIPYGGGPDLDPVTATAADVRKDKVIVDKDGNPLTGTMAEKGAATYTPGRANQVIAANQYLAGAQTIKGDANLLAQYIKKNVTIFGVTGTFEGYVPTATDLYLRGNNVAGFTETTYWTFDTGQLTQNTDYYRPYLTSSKVYNLAGFTKCNVQCNMSFMARVTNLYGVRLALKFYYINSTNTATLLGTYGGASTNMSIWSSYTLNGSFSIPFSIGVTAKVRVLFTLQTPSSATGGFTDASSESGNFLTHSAVYRIWLS
ncbi:MAG: hypothetical protein LIP16_11230 [Clostridium sp.]|nr:hypothetical protein [Clostridium sp.]